MQFLIDKSIDDYLAFSDERTRSFQNSPPQIFELIRDVDTLIREVWTGTLDTQTVPAFLNMNAYFSFLAAVRTAISGHVSSVFPLARAALESACYAFLLSKDETLQSVWMNRDKGDDERTACRKAFTSAVKDTAKQLRTIQEEMGDYVQGLYDASITFGAHPNPLSVFRHLEVRDDDGSDHWKVDFTCMYGEDSHEVKHALLACAEYGIVIAYLNAQGIKQHPQVAELNRRFNEVNEIKNAMADLLRHSSAGG